MNSRIIIIPLIIAVVTVGSIQTLITVDCLKEKGQPLFLNCVWVFVDFVITAAYADVPFERVPISSFGIYSMEEGMLDKVEVGQKIMLRSDIENVQGIKQSLVYGVQVFDQDQVEIFADWVEVTLEPKSISSPSILWIPNDIGNYTALATVWESRDNPTAFSAIWEIEFEVISEDGIRLNSGMGDNPYQDTTPPLKQIQSGISIFDVTCRDGLTIGYKKDLSNAICTTPETIYKLERRSWIISPTHSHHDPSIYENDIAALCNSPDDVLVSYGYSKRDDNTEVRVVSFERIQYDGYAGALLTFDRVFDGGMARGANNGYFPYIHCINEFVDTFDGCMNVSHHYSNSNYPIVECLTLDGKKFSYDEVVTMSKNSGIEIYTINHLSSVSLEFVGKTDQIDEMISFSILAPDGDKISAWKEFPPDEGEFRIAVTTEDSLWKQQDGIFTLIAKQVDVPYYETFSEFELVGGRIVR